LVHKDEMHHLKIAYQVFKFRVMSLANNLNIVLIRGFNNIVKVLIFAVY